MARRQSIEENELLARLSRVFRDVGYEGASLAALSAATGLKKASLYHRFPGGKQQMAQEVLTSVLAWFEASILAPLRSPAAPAERLATVARRLDQLYAGGEQACLLNMLAAPRADPGPFSAAIRSAFEALISAFTAVARDSGHDIKKAKWLAERTVMMLHGSLVMSRGTGSSAPFRRFLAGLPDDLIAASPRR